MLEARSVFRSPLLRLAGALALSGLPSSIAQAQDLAPQTQTLQCTAKAGEGVQLEGGVLMTYFSAGTAWTVTMDIDNAMASVDLRTDKRGNQIAFSEKYRININAEYYILLSTEVKTGALSNGVYNIHDIETTINRRTGEYRRMLRVQNLNSNTGTYAYHSEVGDCAVKPAAAEPAPAAPVKF